MVSKGEILSSEEREEKMALQGWAGFLSSFFPAVL